MIRCALIFILSLSLFVSPSYAQEAKEKKEEDKVTQESPSWPIDLPRSILALYKGSEAKEGISDHPLHLFLEMPLNHLGLTVHFWDIEKGMPNLKDFPPLKGIVSWFYSEKMNDPETYLTWGGKQIEAGLKFLIIENLGAYKHLDGKKVEQAHINNFLNKLGVQHQDYYQKLDPTAATECQDERYVYFEQSWINNPPGIDEFVILDSLVESFIVVEMLERRLPVCVIGPKGGITLEAYFIKIDDDYKARWIVNPFYFLGRIFEVTLTPKPDVTTHCGRRIYFSHIDGDSWRSGCQMQEYIGKICPELIYEKVMLPNPNLPVTVAPIAADLDPDWYGTARFQEIAHKIFELPFVEAGSHTYSHPFAWGYYNTPNPSAREASDFTPDGKRLREKIDDIHKNYDIPRAYLKKPFDLEKEVVGSLQYVKKFLPYNKDIKLLQWSGNCKPYQAALVMLEQNHFLNINGGDSRFDRNFPSYSAVCPLGRNVGGYRQIYAVNSNENTYTEDWTQSFHSFKYLKETYRRTELPIRVKGMNLYYHMYSAEKEASFAALLSNIDYIQRQEIIPLETSQYVEIANSFYETRITQESENEWRILKRGKLQTIRFDKASDKWVDFKNSEGVIGARHHQGSLYVALDPMDSAPLIRLIDIDEYYQIPRDEFPFLENSHWRIWDVKRNLEKITFQGQGYGDAVMTWGGIAPGKYRVTTKSDKNTTTTEIKVEEDKLLSFDININGLSPVQFEMNRVE